MLTDEETFVNCQEQTDLIPVFKAIFNRVKSAGEFDEARL